MPVSFDRSHAESQYRFIKAIWDDRPPKPDLRDGAHVQDIMEAAQISSQKQQLVSLSELH
jgi:predicted dehydrogenase